jgi:putative nucleotidyltransferase with HDIG domain
MKRKQSHLQILITLNTILEARNGYSKGHSQRVAKYAKNIAQKLIIDREEIEIIELAALLHDIGKIGISDFILQKPARLTDKEYAIIKIHSEIGSRILGYFSSFRKEQIIVRHHHENYDGSGYPDGLKGKYIPIGARILSIVDAYDIMTSQQPYHISFTDIQAVNEIKKCSGYQFDPELTEVFFEIMEGKKCLIQSHR